VAINGRTTINVVLQPTIYSGQQMVVIGYGKEKKKNLVGSQTSIKTASAGKNMVTNSEQMLEGAKGLYVQQTSGQPGKQNINIHIRGIGTTHNTNPLILINGVKGSLANVNPDDIKSITVLKDAASTAIYGSRAANGVILVKTKSGNVPGQKGVQLEYRGTFGLQQATTLPDLVTNSVTFMKARNTAAKNEGVAPTYTDEMIEAFKNNSGTDKVMYPNTDWMDVVFRTAPVMRHNLSATGGWIF
jgi:TonB-dependent SusC/RagA subfamily outer membrane receptor